MNIKELVPPLELCKLIPDGEFEDAAFAWHYTGMVGFVCRTSGCEQVSGKQWMLVQSNASRIIRARKRGEQIYPAPTLEEIMEELPHSMCYRHANSGRFTMRTGNGFEASIRDNSPSTAALKLWLKLKGIEDGN